MIAATDQLAEAERIQRLLVESGPAVALRLAGSLAVWYYCRGRTDILDRSNRVPRDIDFIYSAGGAAAVVRALQTAGYDCDMRLAQESQGSRLRAERGAYKVDAFADPVVLRQTLHLGRRLEICSPCIPLTDLLLLKLQLQKLADRDCRDVCALLETSHRASEECWRLDTKRIQAIVASAWTWWKAVGRSLDNIEEFQRTMVITAKERRVILAQIANLHQIVHESSRPLRWRFERAADAILPDGNEVDET